METNYLMASISGKKSNEFNSKTQRKHKYMKYKSAEKNIYMFNHEQEPDTLLHIHTTIFGVWSFCQKIWGIDIITSFSSVVTMGTTSWNHLHQDSSFITPKSEKMSSFSFDQYQVVLVIVTCKTKKEFWFYHWNIPFWEGYWSCYCCSSFFLVHMHL